VFFLSPTWIFLIVRLECPRIDNKLAKRRKGSIILQLSGKNDRLKITWWGKNVYRISEWFLKRDEGSVCYKIQRKLLPRECIYCSRIGIKESAILCRHQFILCRVQLQDLWNYRRHFNFSQTSAAKWPE